MKKFIKIYGLTILLSIVGLALIATCANPIFAIFGGVLILIGCVIGIIKEERRDHDNKDMYC